MKKSYVNISIHAILLLLFFSCKPQKEIRERDFINKEFNGFWGETSWTYKFSKDGTFTMKAEGHYDFSTYMGVYTVLDSLLLLVPEPDWQVFDGVLKTKLKITSSDCIRDFHDNFYCTSIDSINIHNDRKHEFHSSIITLIDSLPETIKAKKEALTRDSTVKFSTDYERIIVVNHLEYHAFSLNKKYEKELKEYVQESFLVKKQPLEIYLHNLNGNSLRLIYKK
ncbi:MAG: hypothetical protein MUE81_10555 [Thermoflexibacter sp.]|jgi:hypothetical protein|nr:hypothetical protein [Thermoflexibacter sp.]